MAETDEFDLDAEVTAQEKAAESAETRKLVEDMDLDQLMREPKGRRFMWRLLSEAGVYRLSYAGENTHVTAFAEGTRNVGLFWIAELQRVCPHQYVLMTKENSK